LLYQTPKKTFLTMPITVCNPEGLITQPPSEKISKIPSENFVAFRNGVCMPNLSSLASNLCKEMLLADRWTTTSHPCMCMWKNFNVMKNPTLLILCSIDSSNVEVRSTPLLRAP